MARLMINMFVLLAFLIVALEFVRASDKLIVDRLDWKPIAEMDTSIQFLGESVGELTIPVSYNRCTAFFIRPQYIMTASHCVTNQKQAKGVNLAISETYDYTCDKLVMIDRYFDYSILKCREEHYTFIPVQKIPVHINEDIKIIHVNCNWKDNKSCKPAKIISTDKINRIFYRDIVHRADTLGGSSGAPIFNKNNELIGIHHSGSILNSRGLIGAYNFGTKIISIDNLPDWVFTR